MGCKGSKVARTTVRHVEVKPVQTEKDTSRKKKKFRFWKKKTKSEVNPIQSSTSEMPEPDFHLGKAELFLVKNSDDDINHHDHGNSEVADTLQGKSELHSVDGIHHDGKSEMNSCPADAKIVYVKSEIESELNSQADEDKLVAGDSEQVGAVGSKEEKQNKESDLEIVDFDDVDEAMITEKSSPRAIYHATKEFEDHEIPGKYVSIFL